MICRIIYPYNNNITAKLWKNDKLNIIITVGATTTNDIIMITNYGNLGKENSLAACRNQWNIVKNV